LSLRIKVEAGWLARVRHQEVGNCVSRKLNIHRVNIPAFAIHARQQ
jgi:hypothetical protein